LHALAAGNEIHFEIPLKDKIKMKSMEKDKVKFEITSSSTLVLEKLLHILLQLSNQDGFLSS